MTTLLSRLCSWGVAGVFVLIGLFFALGPAGYATAQVSLTVTPAYAYITEQEPHGTFLLRNEGTERVEVVASAHYGVIESDSAGTSTHITLDEGGSMGDLTAQLAFFPDRLILEPGQERVVRFQVRGAELLADGGHIALMHYQMQERHGIEDDEVPAIATGLNIVYKLVAPIVLIKGEGAAMVDASMLSVEDDRLNLVLTNRGEYPFVGGVTASVEREGQLVDLGRTESAVYTQRRVEIPLSEVPPGRVVLQFDSTYGGLSPDVQSRVAHPEPITIAW